MKKEIQQDNKYHHYWLWETMAKSMVIVKVALGLAFLSLVAHIAKASNCHCRCQSI